jgi:hypothetical protein
MIAVADDEDRENEGKPSDGGGNDHACFLAVSTSLSMKVFHSRKLRPTDSSISLSGSQETIENKTSRLEAEMRDDSRAAGDYSVCY